MSSYYLFYIKTLHKLCLPLNSKYLSILDWQQDINSFPPLVLTWIFFKEWNLNLIQTIGINYISLPEFRGEIGLIPWKKTHRFPAWQHIFILGQLSKTNESCCQIQKFCLFLNMLTYLSVIFTSHSNTNME